MAARSRGGRRASNKKTARKAYWSAAVMQESDALDLEAGAFTWRDPRLIAESLKRSAEQSRRRKTGPYQSAMSMLNFYVNRAGRNLSPERRRILAKAKIELRRAFGRTT